MTETAYPPLIDLAAAIFPDDRDLALYIILAEARSGVLPSEVIGDDEPVEGEILAAVGVTLLAARPYRIPWYAKPRVEQHELQVLLEALYAIVPDMTAKGEIGVEAPPRTVATLALHVAADGRRCVRLYRHPTLTHAQAVLFLRDSFKDIAPKRGLRS